MINKEENVYDFIHKKMNEIINRNRALNTEMKELQDMYNNRLELLRDGIKELKEYAELERKLKN